MLKINSDNATITLDPGIGLRSCVAGYVLAFVLFVQIGWCGQGQNLRFDRKPKSSYTNLDQNLLRITMPVSDMTGDECFYVNFEVTHFEVAILQFTR